MRPLLINDNFHQQMRSLKEYAQAHPITAGDKTVAGDHAQYTRHLFGGFKVVFSIQIKDDIHFRYLSVSVDTPGKLPNEAVVILLMEELGYTAPIEECYISFEQFLPGHDAICIGQIINDEN